jgi:general secretion pathway protein D
MVGRTILVAAILSFLASQAPAQQEQQKMVLNFHDADIRSFIEAVGQITGKTFIIDPAIKGSVTIVSANPVAVDIVYDIALHALRLQGISAYKTGDVVTIAPETKSRMGARELYGAADKTTGSQVVTKIFPLQFAPTGQIAATLKPLMTGTAALSEFSLANTLVITDYADSIDRLASLIEKLDQPRKGALEVLKLKHIASDDFVKLFESVYAYSAGSAAEPRSYVMIPDLRTNSVIVRSDNAVISGQINSFASRVDVPVSEGGGIRVVKLRYADPAKLATILRGIKSGKEQEVKVAKASNITVPPPPQHPGSAPAVPGKAVESVEIGVTAGIHVDDDTHSLVIAGPENVFNLYKTIIDSLDVPRKQVFIEGLIAEVTTSKIAEFGVQWQSARGLDANTAPTVMGVGGTNFPNPSTPSAQAIGNVNTGGVLSAGTGLNIGVINGTITLANGTIIPNLLSLAHALESDQSGNILSTPSLLALDNEEAKINVGQNVGIPTGSYANTGQGGTAGAATVSPFTTYERKDVGLELKIKTRIMGDDMVQLDVSTEVSNLVPGTSTQTGGYSFDKRSVNSKVMVKDGKVIVIGGLITDVYNNGSDKVPLLGDIPLIGALFRYDAKRRDKRNLMVFLKPEIMASPEDARFATINKHEGVMQSQGDLREYWNPVLPTLGGPKLPKLDYDKKTDGAAKASPPVGAGLKPALTEGGAADAKPAAKATPASPPARAGLKPAPAEGGVVDAKPADAVFPPPAEKPGIMRSPTDPLKK